MEDSRTLLELEGRHSVSIQPSLAHVKPASWGISQPFAESSMVFAVDRSCLSDGVGQCSSVQVCWQFQDTIILPSSLWHICSMATAVHAHTVQHSRAWLFVKTRTDSITAGFDHGCHY